MSADAHGPLELWKKRGVRGVMANRQVFTESRTPNLRVSTDGKIRICRTHPSPANEGKGETVQGEKCEPAGSGNEERLECGVDLES